MLWNVENSFSPAGTWPAFFISRSFGPASATASFSGFWPIDCMISLNSAFARTPSRRACRSAESSPASLIFSSNSESGMAPISSCVTRNSALAALSPASALALSSMYAVAFRSDASNPAASRWPWCLAMTFPSESMKTRCGNPRPPFFWSRSWLVSPSILVVMWQNNTTFLANSTNASSRRGPLSNALHGGQPA